MTILVLDGREYLDCGLMLWPLADLSEEEVRAILEDTEPVHSAARDNRPADAWEPVQPARVIAEELLP